MDKLQIGIYKGNDLPASPAEINVGNVGKDNLSMLITGASGSGKTVAAEKLLIQLADENNPLVFVIDSHGTMAPNQIYEPLREQFEAKVNRLDAYNEPIKCHLFDSAQFPDGTIEKSRDIANSIAEIITSHYKLGHIQHYELSRAIRSSIDNGKYWEKGIASIETALTQETDSKSARTVANRLESLFESNVFQDGNLFIQPGKINILDLSKYDPKLQALISEIVLYYIWHISFTGKWYPVFICIDEFQNIGIDKNGILARILAEGRKYGINCILITQSLGIHFGAAQQKLLCQTRYKFFFRPSESDIKSCLELISGRNETDNYRSLKTLKPGECLVTGPVMVNGKIVDNTDIIRIIPEDSAELYGSPKHVLDETKKPLPIKKKA